MINSLSKYLILVIGNNGGTGKTTLARGIIDVLASNNIDHKAFDADTCNLTLSRFYPSIDKLDFSNEDGADQIVQDMDAGTARILIADLQTGGGAMLKNYNKGLNIFSEAKDLGYQLRIVSALSPSRSSLNSLKYLMDLTGDPSVHVVFKNLFWGVDKFTLFDESPQKQELIKYGGLVLKTQEIRFNDFMAMDKNNLTFPQAKESEEYLRLGERNRVGSWLEILKSTILVTAKESVNEAVAA